MKVVFQREYIRKYYQKYKQEEVIKYLIKDKSIFHWISGQTHTYRQVLLPFCVHF